MFNDDRIEKLEGSTYFNDIRIERIEQRLKNHGLTDSDLPSYREVVKALTAICTYLGIEVVRQPDRVAQPIEEGHDGTQ